MESAEQLCKDYGRIEQAIQYIYEHVTQQPGLEDIAAHLSLSQYHFQRLFTRWAGISPKKFIQYLTLEYTKSILHHSRSLFDAALDSGLSGSSRLHELFVNFEAMTPGEYRDKGRGLEIAYGFYPSPFGEYLLAVTEKGICGLTFVEKGDPVAAEKELKKRWPLSEVFPDSHRTKRVADQIEQSFIGEPSGHKQLGYVLKGTSFQIKVWQALLRIPFGTLVSYKNIAVMIGMPGSVRAVANAIAKNSIAFLIPCHRVITSSGKVGGYHWGNERKTAIIGREAAIGEYR